VLDADLEIDMDSIGKLVSAAISQQFGFLAPRAPIAPDKITHTSNRFNLLSTNSPKTTTHSSSSLATPATKKGKVSLSDENVEFPKKQKPDLVKEYKVEPVYLSRVKPELIKNMIKLGKEFKKVLPVDLILKDARVTSTGSIRLTPFKYRKRYQSKFRKK
jgi:hypothetical protein